MFKNTFKAASRAAGDEIVPFLRQIAAGLDDGKPLQKAYADALEQTTIVKHLLGTPEKGLPFSDGLVKAAKRSGIRTLMVFAQQVHLNEQAGGNLTAAVRKSVETAEQIAKLQQTARKDYQRQQRLRRGKIVLLGAAVAGAAFVARRQRRS